MNIRNAIPEDIIRLTEIYNDYILHSTATFDLEPYSPEARMEWVQAHTGNHPLLVLTLEDGDIAGYASLSTYNPKFAYNGTVELSIYLDQKYRGLGYGKALMDAILCKAREDKTIHTVISLITTENESSLKFHEKYEFTLVGTIKETGYKFERYLDVAIYQLMV